MRKFLCFLLWSTIVFVTLVILFYVEEDLRGARAWAKEKSALEAVGETLDASRFVPPPIPDAQNFGSLPFSTDDQFLSLIIRPLIRWPCARHSIAS